MAFGFGSIAFTSFISRKISGGPSANNGAGNSTVLGGGNDTLEVPAGSSVSGPIDGGAGNDKLKLVGSGVGTLGANANFETLDVQSGMWTLQSDAYDKVNVAAGAIVMSQLKLADQGEMTVAQGGSVLVTNGSDAVVTEGSAGIENAGLIQALGVQNTTLARALVTNGGEIHNKAGGIILAQGAAIASGAAAVAELDIVNEGLIQGLAGQAIVLSGDKNDSLTNKAMINGSVDLGGGNDALNVHAGSTITGAMLGGAGSDTVNLIGTTPATADALGATAGFEHLVLQEGTWSVAVTDYDSVTVEDGAFLTSTVTLNNDDRLTVENGGTLASGTAIIWAGGGDAVVENAGRIEGTSRVLNTTSGANGSLTINNLTGGIVRGPVTPQQAGDANAVITINNAGTIESSASGRTIDFRTFDNNGANAVINNLAGGLIQKIGSDDADVIRPGAGATVNNRGTITSGADFVDGGDAIDFQSDAGGAVNNFAGGLIEGSKHAVTGEHGIRVVNDGTMIGRNGSAVNVDNDGSEAEKVFITNRGTMEGRSAELADSDGDAVDVDGLVQILNYGRIAGMGAEGYHDGGPNVSEGIAVGGGTILNYGANAVIYGYGRGIQVDNSGNSNALGKTFINNEGLIQGDGHGPEGVDPEDAAAFDLRGNEAINLVGDYDDEILNQSTGRILGGVSMGGGNDHLQSLGSFTATGGSAIDMGAGNDTVYFYTGTTVQGSVLLGGGNDLLLSTAGSGFVIDAGDGNDQIYLDSNYSGNDLLSGGAGDDYLYAGAGNDRIGGGDGNDMLSGENGDDVVDGGAGDDTIMGGNGADTLGGGEGNDTIQAGADDNVDGGTGNDTIEVSTWNGTPASIDGGEGDDTVELSGPGAGVLGATTGVENLVVQEGSWSVAASDYVAITIKSGATVTSPVALNNDDHLTIDAGGKLTGAISRSGNGNIVVDNSGLIEVSGRVLNGGSSTGTLTLNNLAGATIKQTGSDTDVIRPGQNGTINNWGTITTAPGFAGGGDLIDFQGNTGGKVNNNAGGHMEGSRHAVTGDHAVTVVNDGTMIGRNGSAVNIDNNGSEADKVFITNRGTMEGRSAELSDSDGDAIDVDGLAQILNYGRISGLGHQGYHDGEPNISEGIAVGGGTILNYGANAVIYGYGRGIQVDNSSNSNALGKTFINNEGLIQGDGHGPEGVSAADAAAFDLRGNEAINLVGDYDDEILNQSTGRTVGGVSMGGGNDHLQSLGSFTATGGSAIDMGAGNDTVYFYTGTTVQGSVLLGTGDDLLLSTADAGFTIDGGDGNDQMYISGYTGGDDVIRGGAGNDRIYSGLGEDRIDGGADNDSLYGEAGDDLIEGGAGDDIIDGGADDDVIYGDAGNDLVVGGLGNDVIKGNAGNDTFVFTSTADGRDSYDGGDGIDTLDFSAFATAVSLTLKDGITTYATDSIENAENIIGGSAADKLTGNTLVNVLTGNAGDDTLRGMAGDDTLVGGDGNDALDGGADNDVLVGGSGADGLVGGNGDDQLQGGLDNDTLSGGAGNDILAGGEGSDILTGGAGIDQFVFTDPSGGADTITDFRVTGAQQDQLVLSASMFENFTGDDAFDLIGSGHLRAVGAGGTTQIQVDLDGGGDAFVTLASVNGNLSNGTLADHVLVQQDLLV